MCLIKMNKYLYIHDIGIQLVKHVHTKNIYMFCPFHVNIQFRDEWIIIHSLKKNKYLYIKKIGIWSNIYLTILNVELYIEPQWINNYILNHN